MDKVKRAKRIVVKVGTSTLTYESGKLNIRRIELLVRVLSDIRNEGREVVLVTSGAVGVGMGKLGLTEKPGDTRGKQAVSAVGQSELMCLYDRMFAEYGNTAAQILLTRDIVDNPIRKQNAVNTLETLLEWGIIPIVNENDSISSDELEFGDNDTLSAVVAKLIGADLLVIFSDIDGLYDSDPHVNSDAKLIPVIDKIDAELMKTAGGAGSKRGTGGMVTKLSAAKMAVEAGVDMIITNGKEPRSLYQILEGEQVGTLFRAARG